MFKTKYDNIKTCKAKDCDTKFPYTKNKQYCSTLCSQRTRKGNDKAYQAAYRAKHRAMTPEQKEVVAQKRRDYYESVKRDELQGQPLSDVERLIKIASENRLVFEHRCHTCGRGCANNVETITESAYELEAVRLKREAKREREAFYDGVEYNETDPVKTDLHYCCQSCYDLKLTDEMVRDRERVYNSAKWRGETV